MLNSFRFNSTAVAAGVAGMILSTVAEAHVSFAAGAVPYAGKSWIGAVNVPHGCSAGGASFDTRKVEIEIPAAFTGVRPSHSTLGTAAVTLDGAVVTKLTWTQADSAVQAEDTHFYQLPLRGSLPATPFTTLEFRTLQTCSDGTVVAWEGADVPKLRLLPARTPGWNQYTIPTGVSLTSADVKAYFSDAQIVWFGQKGYSPNTETTAQIGRTSGASALVTAVDTDVVLTAGDVIWVRY